MDPCWAQIGPYEALMGPYGAPTGPCGAPMGHYGAKMGPIGIKLWEPLLMAQVVWKQLGNKQSRKTDPELLLNRGIPLVYLFT